MKSTSTLTLGILLSLTGGVAAEQITLTPFNTQIDYEQHEIESDFILSRSDGSTEVLHAAVGEDLFQFSGSSNVPPTSHLEFDVHVTPLGGGGGGGGGVVIPYSYPDPPYSELSKLPDEHTQPAPFLVWLGAGAVSATSCAAGWFMARRVLISDCERQGGVWTNLHVGSCGVGTGSSIDCEIEEDNGEQGSLISWQQFAWSNFPWSFQFQNNLLDLSIPSGY